LKEPYKSVSKTLRVEDLAGHLTLLCYYMKVPRHVQTSNYYNYQGENCAYRYFSNWEELFSIIMCSYMPQFEIWEIILIQKPITKFSYGAYKKN